MDTGLCRYDERNRKTTEQNSRHPGAGRGPLCFIQIDAGLLSPIKLKFTVPECRYDDNRKITTCHLFAILLLKKIVLSTKIYNELTGMSVRALISSYKVGADAS